jgi:hypothetical protein
MGLIQKILVLLNLLSISSSFIQQRPTASLDRMDTSLKIARTRVDNSDLLKQIAELNARIESLSIENTQLRDAASPVMVIKYPCLPEWFTAMKGHGDCCAVDDFVREWHDEKWRLSTGGFSGTDYVHSRSRAPVRVLEYLIVKRPNLSREPAKDVREGVFYPSLVGPAYFSGAAESHKGLCHGGSMCALMDDAVGWMGFCITGEPRGWTGYTVQVTSRLILADQLHDALSHEDQLTRIINHSQIDTSLKKSVTVGSTLKLEAWVERREGARKIWICAKLSDPADDTVHCTARGLFLLSPEPTVPDNSKMLIGDDKNKKSKL